MAAEELRHFRWPADAAGDEANAARRARRIAA